MKHGKNMDSEDELFAILDQYMNLSPEELPTREEIEELYPALATEIWRCLEGMKLLKNEESSRQARLSAFVTPEVSEEADVFDDSENSFEISSENLTVTTSHGGKKPDVMLGVEPIGDFELVREIARGGMGVVYEAWQNSLSRLVALKVLPLASTFDERQLQRFRNEAAAAAQLDHPGIVPIYAIGCDRGIHFYAMKLINGSHLGTVIRALRKERGVFFDDFQGARTERDLQKTKYENQSKKTEIAEKTETPIITDSTSKNVIDSATDVNDGMTRLYSDRRQEYFRSVARLMKQVADALEYAHQCGVIHRDIKPANLMLDVDGRLWITDFGLAQVRSDGHLTRTGEVFGTPRYMSPEQAQGHHRLADHRVDIYSLGATFYEFLTLHPIFSETNQVQLLKQITQDAPIKPHVWEPGIPHDLETILLKCIAKMPSERYETAGELAADLERFLENRPILARRPGILEIVAKWNYRHPWALVLVFLTLLAVWIGTVIHHQKILEEKSKTQVALAEAQARFEKARTAADTLVKIAEEELATDNAPKVRRARQKVLDTALVLYQDFLTIDELDPETEQQLTAIRNYVQQFMELLAESNSLPPIFLLMNHDVQEDMALNANQKEKILDFHREFGKRGELLFRDSRNFTQEERVNRLLAQIRETDAFLKEILQPTQVKRLREIQLQTQPERIFDEDVREELNLTEEQVAELENAFAAPYFRSRYRENDHHENGRSENTRGENTRNEGNRRGRYGNLKDRTEILSSVLTTQQLQKWEKMKGKPFTSRRFRYGNGQGQRENTSAQPQE
ncbi:MAG: serine/threonine-protein kinase [Planctomycetia bacterium]|nr:serine/threonine-protein kinase [Planctomycetia bacterium]